MPDVRMRFNPPRELQSVRSMAHSFRAEEYLVADDGLSLSGEERTMEALRVSPAPCEIIVGKWRPYLVIVFIV